MEWETRRRGGNWRKGWPSMLFRNLFFSLFCLLLGNSAARAFLNFLRSKSMFVLFIHFFSKDGDQVVSLLRSFQILDLKTVLYT